MDRGDEGPGRPAAGRPCPAGGGGASMPAVVSRRPRLLCVMGSGETAPTMTPVHAELMERVGSPPAPAVLLDTPFGFQENADEIVARAIAYFGRSVGRPLASASLRRVEDADALTLERALSAVREAAYVFSGPGSPTYALRQWRASQVPALLAQTLREGGCVTFSSAAATTLGRVALPVYEVYKVGETPRWLEGLDLLAAAGLAVAVVPHYDNAEGGTHDTRYCYMGERRLRHLEGLLPDGVGVLGVDEHTACILDLDAGTMAVRGRGAVVARSGGVERRWTAGDEVGIDALFGRGDGGRSAGAAIPAELFPPAAGGGDPRVEGGGAPGPFRAGIEEQRRLFDAAHARADVDAMLGAILALDDHLTAWAADTTQSADTDEGRSALRGMVVRLGEVARTGARDPRELVGPFVDLALRLRAEAREARRFADADAVRDALLGAGVEVRDTTDGTEWLLTRDPAAG